MRVLILFILPILINACKPSNNKSFAVKDIDNVNRIEFISDSSFFTLNKSNDTWLLNSNLTNEKSVTNLLNILSDIEPEYILPKMYEQSIDPKIMVNNGLNIKVYTNNKLLKSWFALYSREVGTLGMIENSNKIYKLHIPGIDVDDYTEYMKNDAEYWQSNILFAISPNEITSVSVTNSNEKESFTLECKPHIKLLNSNGVQQNIYDTIKIKRYLTYFMSVPFSKYYNADEGLTLLPNPAYTLNIKTGESNKKYSVLLLKDTTKSDYGKPLEYNRDILCIATTADTVVAEWLSFDIILKNLSDFVNK